MKNPSFFMVFVEGGNPPNYRHETLMLAEAEAKRLTKLTGKPAYVLCSVKKIEIVEFKETDMRPDPQDDLPF